LAKKDKSGAKRGKKKNAARDADRQPSPGAGGNGEKSDRDETVHVLMALAQTARSFRTLLSRHLLEAGLYAGQDAIILELETHDGKTVSELAQTVGVRAPTVTKTINRLVAQGFVEKRPSSSDGRVTHVHLTETGRHAVASIRNAIAASEACALSGMSGKEIRSLAKLLAKLDANLMPGT